MSSKNLLLTGVMVVALVAVLPAQGKGGKGGGESAGGGGGAKSCGSADSLTRLEEFACRLKLDLKTQLAGVQQIFADAAKDAGPVAQDMISLRNRLINLELTN